MVNEVRAVPASTSSTRLGAGIMTRSSGAGVFPSSTTTRVQGIGGGTRGGPLDDGDEELIDSIEREFLYT